MRISVCNSCVLGAGGFQAILADAMTAVGVAAQVVCVDCMSGCARASTIGFRAAGKTAYLFGDLTADDLAALVTFARIYHASPDGNLADARILGALRTKAIARIPA